MAEFWCSLLQEYLTVPQCAIVSLLPFSTTYLCEVIFSRCVVTKTKYWHRLDVASNMKIPLSTITPNFQQLDAKRKQHHSSY
jgi:hypothetical protein